MTTETLVDRSPAHGEEVVRKRSGMPSPAPSRKSRGGASLIAGTVLLGGLLAAGVVPRLHRQAVLKEQTETQGGGMPIVNVVTPIHATSAEDLELPGNIEPVEQTAVNARTSGYVRKWYVDIGAHVKAGQVLADIESPEVDQQLAQARADEAKARAAVAQSRAALGTTQAGVEQAKADSSRFQAAISQADADSAKAQATVQQARAEETRAQAGVTAGKADVTRQGANVGQSRAALARAQASLGQARQDLATRKANLVKAKSDMEIARKTSERWASLVKDGAVSGQEADEKKAAFEARQADVDAAATAVNSSEANVQAAQSSVDAARSDVAAAEAGVGASEANVQAAEAGTHSTKANIEAMQASSRSSLANVEAARSAYRSSLANVRAAQQKVDAARSDVQSAEAALNSAQANVRRYVVLQSFEHVSAPFNGVVTARNVDSGTLVSAGGSTAGTSAGESPTASTMRGGLFGIARTDTLRIQVQVPQTFITAVKTGQKAMVGVREFPHREFEGQIFQVAGALDPSSRTRLVEIRVTNPQGLLVPGMYATAKLTPAGAFRPLRIPAAVLITNADGTQVAIVTHDHKIHLQKVDLGEDLGTEIEVVRGLNGNEQLVSNPGDNTTEGTTVKVEAVTDDEKSQGAAKPEAGAKPGNAAAPKAAEKSK